jgi:hypothetical protein
MYAIVHVQEYQVIYQTLHDEVMQGEVNTKDQIFMGMHETHNSEKMPSLVAMISIVAEYFKENA